MDDKLTARETKNKILADMETSERIDAVVAETREGGFIIMTERAVYEVYHSGRDVYAQRQELEGSGWEPVEVTA